MKNIIGLKELRQNLQKYSSAVQKGESFIIMKRSAPLFKICPVEDGQWEEVIDFTKIQRGGVNIEEVLQRI